MALHKTLKSDYCTSTWMIKGTNEIAVFNKYVVFCVYDFRVLYKNHTLKFYDCMQGQICLPLDMLEVVIDL